MFKTLESKPEFSVSKDGQIKFNPTGYVLSAYKDKDGYLRVATVSSKGKHYVAVHRAVAEAYVGNPDKTTNTVVNHLNGVKDDNRPENLEWTTHSKNRVHSLLQNGHNQKGENHSQCKLKESQVKEIINLLKRGLTQQAIAEMFGIHKAYVSLIKSGRSWKHLDRPESWVKRRDTFSMATLEWVKDQLVRGRNENEILNQAKTLTKCKLKNIISVIKECNDYPEREYTQVGGNSEYPKQGKDIV